MGEQKKQHITYRHLSLVLNSLPWLIRQLGGDRNNAALMEAVKSVFPVPSISTKADPAQMKILTDLISTSLNRIDLLQETINKKGS
jgi:hypothetical protein